MEGVSGKGAKYWSTTFDQIEDADTDPKLISQKLGLEHDANRNYVMLIVDTEKAAPLTGVKSIPATFEKVGEFASTERPFDFPKSFIDEAMTPEFQVKYAEHYNGAVDSGKIKPWSKDVNGFEDYLKSTDLTEAEQEAMRQRMNMHDIIGNNQDYVGNGLTKDLIENSPNNYGAVETLNFERSEVNLKQLDDAGAIAILTGLKPL